MDESNVYLQEQLLFNYLIKYYEFQHCQCALEHDMQSQSPSI